MKKVLFLSLILATGMMGFAQVRSTKCSDIAKTPVLTHVKSVAGNETPSVSSFAQPSLRLLTNKKKPAWFTQAFLI